jgi:hypothetical protein
VPASLCDVLPSAAALLGVPGAQDRIGLATDRASRVVVVLVDGMGYHLLPTLAPDAPLLADTAAGRAGLLAELACTFPSTTPTSLVSLGTGQLPGQHGVLGFTVRVPGTDRVLTHIFWRDDPPPGAWQPEPTWFQRVARAGSAASVLLPAGFAGSGLTDAAYRGARFVGVREDDDYAARLLDVVRAEPGLTFGYTAALDTAAHLFGVGSTEWHQAAAGIDRMLTRVVEGLPAGAVLLVTADHGGLNVPADARFDVDTDPRLRAGVQIVAGEGRVRYLHTVPGAVDDVVAAWSAALGAAAQVRTRAEVVDSGVFGAVRPEHLERIGEVVVICTEAVAVIASRREPPQLADLVGFHGALTQAETAIPLIAFGPG